MPAELIILCVMLSAFIIGGIALIMYESKVAQEIEKERNRMLDKEVERIKKEMNMR